MAFENEKKKRKIFKATKYSYFVGDRETDNTFKPFHIVAASEQERKHKRKVFRRHFTKVIWI